MKALLLVAHGSRRAAANAEVTELAEALRRRAGDRFDRIGVAFLEFAGPGFSEELDASIAAGAREIVVFPHLLAAGAHLSRDIPHAVAARQRDHPDVAIRIAPHLGRAAGLADLILELAECDSG